MSTKPRFLWIVLVVAATFVVFGRAIGHEFVLWDDNFHVVENPWLHPPSWSALVHFWSEPFLGLYVPVSYTLFLAEAALTSTPDPAVFHAVNLALHAACAALVFSVLRRLVKGELAAACGALLFALHPLQAESASWISETRGTLSALFGLLALERAIRSERVSLRDMVVGSAFFALAVLAKPSAVAFLPIAFVVRVMVQKRSLRTSLAWMMPWTLLALAAILTTKVQQGDEGMKFATPIVDRPLVALDALGFYFAQIVAPMHLGPDYGRRPELVIAAGFTLFALAPIVCTGIACSTAALRATLLPALAIFVAGLVPVLGLVPFGYQQISTVADRYAYPAMIGPALVLALLVGRSTSRVVIAAAALVLCACGAWSFRQCGFWHDSETLFAHALDVNPQSWIAHDNRGLALSAHGDRAGARREHEAALAIKPDYVKAHNNLGLLSMQDGRADDARREFEAALAIDPRYARAHANLAVVLYQTNRFAEAREHAERAVELAPGDPAAHNTLGNVLVHEGRAAEGEAEYESALSIRPLDPDANLNLARLLMHAGRPKLAIDHYRTALRANPRTNDAALELALILASVKVPSLRDPHGALVLAERALAATNDPGSRPLTTLAAAQAANGSFPEAVSCAQRALALAKAREPERVAEIEKMIQLFTSGKSLYDSAP